MEAEAPYRRIVADLRGRIERGELKPGDRVPSTRGITQEFGVAMATASKVIAALREEGLVETRSGAGTVVRLDVGRPRPGVAYRLAPAREHELGRERVVRTAMAIADGEGLATLTMRRVASDLGVATMSLYRHVAGKEELVLLMTDAAFGDHPLPDERPAHWRDRLETAGRRMWTVFRAHPWAAEALSMTRPQMLPNLLGYSEWSLGALRELGLTADEMMYAHLTLFGHVRSVALSLQSETLAEEETGLTNDEWVETQGDMLGAAAHRYPSLGYVAREGFDYDLDALLEFGLQRLLDGLTVKARVE
jgi:DNA-binding transcriptional regulator YhcF (GntR family)